MKALVFAQPGSMSISDLACPEPMGDEVLIRVEASGICGTDLHIFQGGFGCDYPLVPGHEFAGEVVAIGSACRRVKVGDRVAVEPNVPCNNCPECLRGEHHYCRDMVVPGVNRPGGIAEHVVVPERGVFDIGALPYTSGALVEPLSCVIHATERLDPRAGERILVMGAGPIGLLMGRMIRARGAVQVDYLERDDDRRAYAARMGLGTVHADTVALADNTYDAVADATGVSALVSEAANRLVRARGRVLVFGVPSQTATLSLDHFRVYRDEIQIIASFTSLKNSQQAVDIMTKGIIEVDDIVSHTIALSECPTFIHRMQAGNGAMRKVTVTRFSA